MPLRCVVVTNVPTPYRAPVWEILGGIHGIELHVVYCSAAHIDPSQDGRSARYQTHFLSGRYQAMDNRFFHADWSIWRLLDQIRPDVVITSGFIPTFLYAFAWSVVRRVSHVPMTDGTDESEKSLTWKHRWVRRLVYAFSRSFIGACEGSRRLYEGYGVKPSRIHLAPLCADNARFSALEVDKEFDLIFCGRFVEHKNPILAMDVACGVARRLRRRVSLRFVGQGALEARMREHARGVSEWVDVSFAGYLSQDALPMEYARARVFVFPTAFDPWGVVVNEACAAGVPCVVSPHTGVAGELIRDGVSGFVCALADLQGWIDRCYMLLSDEFLRERMSLAASQGVSAYTFECSAQGVRGALSQAAARGEACLGR